MARRTTPTPWGHWLTDPRFGDVDVVVSGVRRRLILLDPLGFRDPDGREHWIKPGYQFDGASMPAPFPRLFGARTNARYRRATCLHDFDCEFRIGRSWDVHERLYRSLRADDCPAWIAHAWRAAVHLGGPSFSSPFSSPAHG